MDLGIPEELLLLVASIERFVEREVRPLEEENAELLRGGTMTPEVYALTREVTRRAVAAGLYGLSMPEDSGGGGLGELPMCLLREAVASRPSPLVLNLLGDLPFGPNRMILELATPEQHERYFLPLVRGDATTCIALTEPDAGSDLAALRTKARPEDGGWVLNGQKHYITNAFYADFLTVLARTDGGYTFFLVDRDAPGLTVRPPSRTMGGEDLQSEIFFDDCRLGPETVLGEEGRAFEYAMRFLANERLSIAAMAVGLAQYLVDLMIGHARERVQFGSPIGSNQAIQWLVADSLTELYAARTMCHDAAWRADQGEDVLRLVSMVKLFSTEMVGRVADRAVQVFGGMGYMCDGPVERIYRLVRVMRIGGGTSEIQRMLVARASGL